MRLYLYVKNALDITRREITKLHEENRILVNGNFVNLTYDVADSDKVSVDGKVVKKVPFVYYLYNKPIGIVCTNNKEVVDSIRNRLDIPFRVYPIGRLDKESRGLLILTNDSSFTHKVLSTHYEKEYIVQVKDIISDEFIANMPKSMVLRGKETLPCKVEKVDDYHFLITLNEGKYHQIRRMVVARGNKVIDLQRIRIGNIKLNDLEEGSYKKIDNLPAII